jgi:hypothetical protein
MKTTTERHKICALGARDAAESLEAGARNPALAAWARIHYAALARMERLSQAYHEEAAELTAQGLEVKDWIDWLQARGI